MPRISSMTGGFAGYQTVSLSLVPTGGGSEYSGSTMVFVQTSAPTNWTKVTSYNDYALRVVSGAASSGGSANFSSVYTVLTPAGTLSCTASAGNTTLASPQIPSHSHNTTLQLPVYPVFNPPSGTNYVYTGGTTGPAGSGAAHNHTITTSGLKFTGTNLDISVKYVDAILAKRN